ncbi:MAG: hypothetical protein RL748_2829 [Pseudomonadota bacterium]|jgi:hypothetical protein
MQIWALLLDGLNQYSVLVPLDDEDEDLLDLFCADGKSKNWPTRPKVQAFIEKRKKIAEPRADISYSSSGSVVLNQKTYQSLEAFQ